MFPTATFPLEKEHLKNEHVRLFLQSGDGHSSFGGKTEAVFAQGTRSPKSKLEQQKNRQSATTPAPEKHFLFDTETWLLIAGVIICIVLLLCIMMISYKLYKRTRSGRSRIGPTGYYGGKKKHTVSKTNVRSRKKLKSKDPPSQDNDEKRQPRKTGQLRRFEKHAQSHVPDDKDNNGICKKYENEDKYHLFQGIGSPRNINNDAIIGNKYNAAKKLQDACYISKLRGKKRKGKIKKEKISEYQIIEDEINQEEYDKKSPDPKINNEDVIDKNRSSINTDNKEDINISINQWMKMFFKKDDDKNNLDNSIENTSEFMQRMLEESKKPKKKDLNSFFKDL